MTTAYTSLLGLALPVTGELSGTWGDTVNNSITSLLDSAVAGTQTLTADTTLTTTTGAANQSRQAILLCSPASANITITAPAQSKIYTVINTSATYTVTVRGVGPTTGVTLGVSEKAVVAWNGSDFVKISNTTGDGTFANLTVTGNTTLGNAVADTITVNGQFVTGTVLRSAQTATNTLALAAYDTDGAAYTNLITLTASTTPTLALTSTGVGTINNMSIGATTASTGAFTTLSASSTVSGTGFSTYLASPPAIGGTAAAAGTFTTLSSTGNTTIGDAVTDTITVNGQFVTGTVLRSAQTATNTLALAAYDTDGAAYTNLITLTASTTPTLALTSTGVGTINNMSIGATTASTGAFTTLSASSTVSGTGFSTYLASPPAIGGTTAAAGAFTTLSASSTVSGTGFSTYLASPPAIGGTTAAAGTFTDLTSTGNTTIGNADTDTITQAASYVTGTQLKSAKTATNTLNLAAYDTDGAAYTNLITLTASTTPTLALTSTGVGTINNMSIGATTAATGSFTSLAYSTTLTGGTGIIAIGTNQIYKDAAGKVGIGTASPAVTLAVSATDAVLVPVGTTAQRPTGASGYLRFNSTITQFEGFNGTAWSSVGGGATGGGADQVFIENSLIVTTNYTITTGKNAMSTGPITINSGVTVTIPTGARWVVL